MDENEAKTVEEKEQETKKAEEKKTTESSEKKEKVGVGKRIKRFYRRHKGAVWGTVCGFAAGAGSMFGITELGRRHHMKMAEKAQAVPMDSTEGYSSLDPNVD